MPNKLNHSDPITPARDRWMRRKKQMSNACRSAVAKTSGANAALTELLAALDPADVDDTRDAAVAELMATEPNLIADLDGMIAQWAEQTGQDHLDVLAKLADKYATDQSESRLWLKLQIGLAIDAL